MLYRSYKLLLSAITIFILVIIFDLIINILLPEKFKKTIGTTRNYSLKSVRFHHKISPNINLYEHWGKNKYKVITNKLAMRVKSIENTYLKNKKENIAFIGDSFVYGSGIKYKNHFINLIHNKNQNYNYLNLGYVSYSPSIYYKRLKFFIEEKDLKFKKVFIFVDHSDIQDEGIFYREDFNGNIVRKWLSDDQIKKRNNKNLFKNYLKQNSFIFKLYENLSSPNISEKSKNCLNNKAYKNFKNFIDKERFGYSYNMNMLNKYWVKEGIKKTKYYLNKINDLSKKNNFILYIVYYPSALEIIDEVNINLSKHYHMLKKISQENNLIFVNAANKFYQTNNGNKNYLDNFIECDSHWNKNGHKIIAETIKKYINE